MQIVNRNQVEKAEKLCTSDIGEADGIVQDGCYGGIR